jgi:hypothetical protein
MSGPMANALLQSRLRLAINYAGLGLKHTVRPFDSVVHSVVAGSTGVAKFLFNGRIDRKACLLRRAWFKLNASRREAIATRSREKERAGRCTQRSRLVEEQCRAWKLRVLAGEVSPPIKTAR